jgi:hypothetical protein
VLADQVLDLGFGLLVERVIGGTHVRELGIAAGGRDHARRKQRVFRGNGSERTVGVPEPIAEIEHAPPVVADIGLRILIEIGDVNHQRLQPLLVRFGDVAAARILDAAEILAERDLLIVGNALVAEYQDGVTVHAGLDRGHLFRRHRLAQVGARNLADEDRMQRADGYGHEAVSAGSARQEDDKIAQQLGHRESPPPEAAGQEQVCGREHDVSRDASQHDICPIPPVKTNAGTDQQRYPERPGYERLGGSPWPRAPRSRLSHDDCPHLANSMGDVNAAACPGLTPAGCRGRRDRGAI